MKKTLVGSIIALLIFAGCKYEEGNKEVKVSDKYTISIPNFLSETDRLAPDALIQYENKFRSFYLICAAEEKEGQTDLDAFTKEVIKSFTDQIAGINVKKINAKQEINGFPAQFHELTGTVSQKGIFYLLATLETPSHFYQICTWTLLSKKDQHEQTFHEIVNSFKKI